MSNVGQKPAFSLVLTFFNEEPNVVRVLTALVGELDKAGLPYELVGVNNGSHDSTGSLLATMAETRSRLRVVHVATNVGYGNGVIQGLREASGGYVGYFGGDGQVTTTDVVRVCRQALCGEADIVKVLRVKRHDGVLRSVISRVYNWLFEVLFGRISSDVNGTPKVFRRELLDVLDLRSKDWFLDAEFMIKAKHLGLSVCEVPIVFRERVAGASSVRMRTVGEFLKNMWSYSRGEEFRAWKRARS